LLKRHFILRMYNGKKLQQMQTESNYFDSNFV